MSEDAGQGPDADTQEHYCDVVVVGAGFSGLYTLHRLRELGYSTRVFEKADDVGGTWYWNRYPGCRVDSESHVYKFSFSEELYEDWEYSERYPEQEEILEYLRFVADRLELRRDIEFGTAVQTATFDEEAGLWRVQTDAGDEVTTQFLVLAVGPLSEPFVPDFDGLEAYDGELYHTARWPHEPVSFAGADVAVIGTGSSGIQAIPRIAERARHLTVYQRTPNYAVPAHNHSLSESDWAEIRANYDEIWERARRTRTGFPFSWVHRSTDGLSEETIEEALEERWEQGGFRFFLTFGDLLSNEETNERVSEFIRSKLRDRIDDPELADTLIPENHPYGAKRPPLDYDGYYETFTRDDVSLVDVSEFPIQRLTETGIETADSHREHDIVVLATGFDAITGAFTSFDIHGLNGTTLEAKWADRPRAYLGFAIDGFPNLFMISGPQNPSVITNQPVVIEQQVEWITDCIDYMDESEFDYIEVRPERVEEWLEHSNSIAEKTVYTDANSWYKGDNIPGKPTVFLPYPGGFDNYRERCDEEASSNYEGFKLAKTLEELGSTRATQ
jgi:cyclohexanone monooxygenase